LTRDAAEPDLSGLEPKKILVIQLRRIGDVLLATPAVELLRRRFPHAELHMLTEKVCAPVLENNPNIDRVVVLDKKEHKNPFKAAVFYYGLKKAGYDLVVDFQQLPRCRYAVLASMAKTRLSIPPRWIFRPLYTHWVKNRDGYAAMAKASLLRVFGIEWDFEPPRIYLTEEEKSRARRTLEGLGVGESDVLVTLDPTHRRVTRCWPAQHYASFVRQCLAARSDIKFLALAGPGEEDKAREVMHMAGNSDRLLLPERVLSLREMAGVIDRASLHVGNCSAPRHFAAALDTPSLTILGATSPAWTCPPRPGEPRLHENLAKNLPCQPCNKNECEFGEPLCLQGLDPRDAAVRALELLDGTRTRFRTAERIAGKPRPVDKRL
jgi:ADP-heptose:LPS heptosyltransferase